MKKEFTWVDEIIGRKDLVEKWVEQRKKEKVLISVADIFLWEPIHRGKFNFKMPKRLKEVTGTIIVQPGRKVEGRYFLVRGWVLYHYAQKLGQERIYAYITHTGRKKFAQKLLLYEEAVKEETEK